MSRVLEIEVPDCNDDEWLRDRLRDLNARLEALLDGEEDEDNFNKLGACLDIVDAMQEYAGY